MPVGFRIASAWVDIRAEDKGLRQQIKSAVEKAAKGQDAMIPLKIDTKGLRREVTDALKAATEKQKPKVAIGIKSTGLRKEVTDALKRATEKQKPTVKLGINAVGLRREVQNALTEATKDQKPTVKLGISSVGLRGEVQRALNAATAGQSGTVTIHARVDEDRLSRALADADPTIRPNVDGRALRQSLMAAIRRINVNDDVHINANIDGDLLSRQIQSEIARLRDKFRVRIHADLDTDTFAARLQAAARSVPSDIDIDLNPRINQLRLRAEAAKAFQALRGKITFDGELNTAMLSLQVKAAIARLNAMPHNLRFRAKIDIDNAQVLAKLAAINALVDRSGGSFSRWAKLAVAGALAIPPALSVLDYALRATGASMAVLVGYSTAFITMGVTIAVGMNNVVNAITNSSDSINKYNEYLDQLTPAARAFVEAVVNQTGAFRELQATVQETMFHGLAKEIREMATKTMPTFTVGLGGMALILNGMAKGVFRTTTALAEMGTLDQMFGGLQLAMEPLVPIPGQIINAIVKLSTAAYPVIIRMNTAFGTWADTMTRRLNAAFTDGTLQRGITQASDNIVNFFKRIANNPEFEEFMARIKANGPAMAEAFGNISESVMKLINALAPVNAIIVTVINSFAQFINALPVEVLSLIITKLVLFKTALMISALVLKLTDAFLMLKGVLLVLGSQAAMVQLLTARMTAMGATAGVINATALAMRALGKAMMGVLALVTIVWIFDKISDRAKGAAPNVDKLSKSLENLAVTGKFTGEMKKTFVDIDGFVKKLDSLNKKAAEHKKQSDSGAFGFKVPGLDDLGQKIADSIKTMDEGGDSLEALKDDFKSLDKAFAGMVNDGNGKLAAKDMQILKEAWVASGHKLADFTKQFPSYKEAVASAKDAQKAAAESMGLFGIKAIEVSDRIQTLKQETEGLVKSLFELNNMQRDANQATRDLKQSAEAMVKATKNEAIGLKFKNGQLVQVTKAQQEAAASMETHAANTEKSALATYTATGSWEKANKTLVDNKNAIIKQAEAAGMGATEAKLYADSILKIPSKKEITIMVADQATEQLGDVAAAYRASPDKKVITVSALNSTAIQSLQDLGYKVRQLPDGRFEVLANTVPAEKDLKKVESFKINPKTVEVLAKITAFTIDINEAQAKVDALKQKRKTAVGADKKKLDAEITKAQKKVDSLKQKRAAEIKALDKTGPGVSSAKKNLNSVKDKKVTITIATLVQGNASKTADAIRKQAEGFAKKKWTGGVIRRASGGSVPGGGAVSGPGGPKSDKVKALLSDGEYVIRTSSVNKYGIGMMNSINTGRWPRFAAGGAVQGGGGTAGAPAIRSGATTGTFTIKDETGKPVASAVQNFKALQTALGTTYTTMNQKTSEFGRSLTQKLAATGTQSGNTWAQWGRGMQTRTTASYKSLKTSADTFGRQHVSRTAATRTQTQGIWDQWKSGMSSRTTSTYKTLGSQASAFQRTATTRTTQAKTSTTGIWTSWGKGMETRTGQTYSKINTATGSFAKQSTTKIGQARDGMGSAWGGLSPKFKPPVSYLIHTVINKGVVGSMNAIMSKLGGGKKVGGIGVAGFATGGPVYGDGSKTSDSIPARLSNGEFVMQASAVDKFGVGFMKNVNSGKIPKNGKNPTGFSMGGGVNIKMPAFASGGTVGVPSADALNKILGEGDTAGVKKMTDYIMNNYVLPLIDSGSGGSAMKDVQRAGMAHIRGNVQAFVKDNFGGAGSAAAGLRWAKTQDGKPYQWGGNGNPSWDCSGFMSAIESVIRGEKPHRRWATGAFPPGTPGWKRGAKAPFQIGITNAGVGHTAGTIGKTNVESSGGGVMVGGRARGANAGLFTSQWGYVGPNATKKASGGYISGPGGPTSDQVPAWLSNGEYVLRSAAVKRMGTGYLNAINSGNIPGFASGGAVSDTSYKIKSGDTLSGIAAKFKTTVSALMALNKSIKDANKIYAGMTLIIKKAASGGSSGGSTGGSSGGGGGFSLGNFSKVGTTGIQSAEGTAALQGFITLSQESLSAGKKDSEIVNSFQGHETTAELLTDLWEVESKIRAAFKGDAQTKMVAAYEKSNKAAIAYQKQLDPINVALGTATEKLSGLKESFNSLKDSITSNIMEFGSITKIGKWGTSPQTLLTQLQTDAGKAGQFGGQLEQLKAMGIDPALIGQIAEAGITGGGSATAATLLRMTPAQVQQLNALQAQLTSAATKAGDSAAKGMYGAGLSAAQGLVNGLEDQKSAIEAKMTEIAKAMEKALKQALGIASPSKVMMRLADFTADGWQDQITARTPGIAGVMQNMVTVPNAPLPGTASTKIATGTISTVSSGTTVHIENINVSIAGTFDLTNPVQRQAIAKTLAKEIKEEIRKDDRAHR